MKFTYYGNDTITRILVAGGGLMNGNACAYIEFITDEPSDIWYVEYGNKPIRKLVGNSGIEWLDDTEFKIIDPIDDDSEGDTDSDSD